MSSLPVITHALSVREPWAWAMTCGFKTIENRSFKFPSKRHPMPAWIAIHASLSYEGIQDSADAMFSVHPKIEETLEHPCHDKDARTIGRSEIVGVVQVVGCLQIPDFESCSRAEVESIADQLAELPPSPRQFGDIYRLEWCDGGGFAWIIGDCYRFRRPIVALGRLNVWHMALELQQLVNRELKWSAANQTRWSDISHRFAAKPIVFEMPKISKQQQAVYE